MRTKFTFVFAISFIALTAYCQEPVPYSSRMQFRSGGGYTFPLTKLLNGNLTDNLVRYNDRSFYIQPLYISYFLRKHWGIELGVQFAGSGKHSKTSGEFNAAIESEFGNNYFIIPDNMSYSSTSSTINRGFLGLVYRYESDRFFIYPKLAIGITSFYTDQAVYYLKEKNSNNVTYLSYAGGVFKDNFTLGASTTAGFKISKIIYVNLEVLTAWFPTNLTYVKTDEDLISLQSHSEEFQYRKNIFNLGIGAGFIIVINRRQGKKDWRR